MKTIILVSRLSDVDPVLLHLLENLFPECTVRIDSPSLSDREQFEESSFRSGCADMLPGLDERSANRIDGTAFDIGL